MIVLDTHVWLWWQSVSGLLSRRAREAIDRTDRIAVSAASCFELAMLAARGKVSLDRDVRAWVLQALAHERGEAISVSPEIAIRAALLEPGPADPFDRLVYATAAELDVPLVTKDRALRSFDPRRTIW
jgi:PIN domain nuclease of toxin-antitoxin system